MRAPMTTHLSRIFVAALGLRPRIRICFRLHSNRPQLILSILVCFLISRITLNARLTRMSVEGLEQVREGVDSGGLEIVGRGENMLLLMR